MRSTRHKLARSTGIALALLPVTSALAAQPADAVASDASDGPISTSDAAARVDPDTLLLFSVDLDNLTLTDSLTAYGDPGDPLLPSSELARLLELDIEVYPSERRIVGRLGEERRSLAVDLATGTARVGGRSVVIGFQDVVITPAEIYIRSSAVQRLLPVDLTIDSSALAITVKAREPLPIQSRMERLSRLRELRPDVGAADEVLEIASPYRFFSPPSFDVNLSAGFESKKSQFPRRFDVRLGGDLLWSGFEGYVGSDETGAPTSARVLFERRSTKGGLLGPIDATAVTAGDVFTPSLPIGPRSASGRGVALTTAPLGEENVFNRVDLRGELPIGYDVELYINDVLRSGQQTPAKGRYEFLNVPLVRGVNIIRIVSYGPRGEREEQTRIVNVGGGQLRKGALTFDLGVVEQDTPVVELSRGTADDDETGLDPEGPQGLRAVANVNYGVTQFLTVSAGAAAFPTLKDEQRQVYTLGARTSVFGISTQLDYGLDDKGGAGMAIGLATQWRGASVVLQHGAFQNDFIDEGVSAATRTVLSRTEATVDSTFELGSRIVPLSLRAFHTAYEGKATETNVAVRSSTSLASVLVTGGVEYGRTTNAEGFSTDSANGFFSASSFIDYKWQVRATLDYRIIPEFTPASLAVTVDRDISENLAVRLGLGQSLDDTSNTNIAASAIVRSRIGELGLTGEFNAGDSSWRVGVQLNFGLGYRGGRGYRVAQQGPGSGANVLFHSFIDKDGDGAFTEGDQPVPGVQIEGGLRSVETDADGEIYITGLGKAPVGRLTVSLEKLENPYVQAPPRTVQFAPRAGSLITVPYPLRPTSEVLVKVLFNQPDGKTVGLSAAQLRLVPTGGGTTVEAVSEFDGSAFFLDVPAGDYELQLASEQARRLRMRLIAPVTVSISADGGYVPDVKAEVAIVPREQLEAEAATAAP